MVGTVKVLVVDDEPVNLTVMSRIVQSAGYGVVQATTGLDCLEVVERERPDLILLDVLLPDLDGPAVSARIKSSPHLEGTYIILVSEKRIARDDRIKGLTGGADAYLPRPFSQEELLAYVETGVRIRGLVLRLQEEVERRRHSEDEVREIHGLLCMAESMAALGSWKWKPHTGEFLASDSLHALLDLPPGAAGGSRSGMREILLERVHADDRVLVQDSFDQCLALADSPAFECRLVRAEGGVRRLRCEMRSLRDALGLALEVYGCVRDVTERFELEQEKARLARLEEEQRLIQQREMVLKNLHDGIGGITANISMLAEVGGRARTLEAARQSLETICVLAREGISEVRGVMDALERTRITWGDLLAEMRRYGSTMLEPHHIGIDMQVRGDATDQEVDPFPWMSLLSLFKEAIANVIKHARAHKVRVVARVDADAIHVTLQDDGVGMEAPRRNGRGIPNMITRAADLGGTLSFLPGPGAGICVTIPLPPRHPGLAPPPFSQGGGGA